MTDTKNHSKRDGSGSLEGQTFRPATLSETGEAIELAFDYRGDITIQLKSGARIEGYVFNRNVKGTTPSLDLFPKNAPGVTQIAYSEIESISFTGEDTASGKSWEAWMKKKESERRAEVERVAADARARGYL
ncbi:MAG TPA: hypothetical protein VIU63_10660 [Nitrospira sp.]